MVPARLASLAATVVAASLVTTDVAATEPVDLYFGEAVFYAHQGLYFDALNRLDSELAQYHRVDEPSLDSLWAQVDQAEFSVGDFELHYRMHHRAGRAIRAVLDGNVPEPVRNDAAFRLARLHFQKGQTRDALHALDRISGEVPERIRVDVELLRANVLMASGRTAEAVEVLRAVSAKASDRGFISYNLGIALLRANEPIPAIQQLDRAGKLDMPDDVGRAIRDKSNLVLGDLLYEADQFDRSKNVLDRVRLEGPFSNRALLRAGWAAMAGERFERAVVPWSILAGRDPTELAVQEALLALPFAYSKLQVHGRAALLYGEAVEAYGLELEKVDASIDSIRDGHFLEALVKENVRHDKDWVVRLRSLPDAPETFYLITLMSSHAFQAGLQNYLDLEDMRQRLEDWDRSLAAFDQVIAQREAYYEPRLPAIDEEFRKLDARIRLRRAQAEHLEERLEDLLVAPRPDWLATAGEQALDARLDALERALAGTPSGPARDDLAERLARLRGLLVWNLESHYHERLGVAHAHLRELKGELETMQQRYDAFVRARQAATHSYEGYTPSIARLRTGIRENARRIEQLMKQQGEALETVSVNELVARRTRLESYLNQARFAFADSYDRASKMQARLD
jgi:hypothetical protein